MRFQKAAAILVALISVSSAVLILQVSNGTDAEQGSRMVQGRDLRIPVGGTEEVHLSTNLSMFRFEDPDDGIRITVSSGRDSFTFVRTVRDHPSVFSDWSESESENVLSTGILNVAMQLCDTTGRFLFEVSLLRETDADLDIRFDISSLGRTQSAGYTYHIIPAAAGRYTVTFDKAEVSGTGIFSAKGHLFRDGVPVEDLTDYAFYAVGLYKGVTVLSDLTVAGNVDISDERWFSWPMPVSLVITSRSGEPPQTVDTEIKYVLRSSVTGIGFRITCGATLMLDERGLGDGISVFSDTKLLLTLSEGTCATVVSSNNGVPVMKKISSPDGTEYSQLIDTQWAGSHVIHFGREFGEERGHVTINVIAPLVPKNNIIIECGPKEDP